MMEPEYLDKLPPDYQEAFRKSFIRSVAILITVIIGMAICALFSSCKSVEYVPVIEHKTDTLIQTNLQRDSIYVHDSIMVSQQGDTVRIDRWHTKYIEKQVHDTLYQAVHDSIPQPYPVIKEVPAELTWWQHFRISLANILLWVVGIVAVVTLVRWWLKQKKVI